MDEFLVCQENAIAGALLTYVEQIFLITADGMILRVWNAGVNIQSQLSCTVGQHIGDPVDVQCRAEIAGKISAVIARCEEDTLICRHHTDHTFADLELRLLPVHPDRNKIFITVARYSRARYSTEEIARIRQALENTGDGVWEIDFEHDVVSFSERWLDIFGYTRPASMTVAEWRAHIHPEDQLRSLAIRNEYFSEKKTNYSAELRFRCADGTYKWILSRGFAVEMAADGSALKCMGTHTDISSRKQSEDKYRSVTNLLTKLINNINIGVLVTDENHIVIYANDKFCEIYGIKVSPEMIKGLTMAECYERSKHIYKFPEQVRHGINETMSNATVLFNEDVELIDGRVLSLDFLIFPLDERVNGHIWKFTDVTDQKNVERRFEAQRMFYENVLHNIPADIAVFDANHTYLFVNRNAFKNEELRQWMIGKTDIDYARFRNRPDSFYLSRFELYDQARDSAKREETIEQLVSREGKVEYHLRIINPVHYEDGTLEFLLAYGLNITDLIEAQQAYKTSSEMFSSAFDYSGIGMALVNPDGGFLDVNAEFCRMIGFGKDELICRTFQDITHPDDLEADMALVNKMLNKEITTYNLEKRYIAKNKSEVLVLLTVSLVWNSDGTPKFFIAQVVDITRKKELEDELRRKNTELQASKDSLVVKVSQLEELSHLIAHNLRGPAGNIKLLSEMLLEEITEPEDAGSGPGSAGMSQRQALQFLSESSTALLSSLSTLMEITEIKLNQEIPYDDCDLPAIVSDIIIQLQTTIYEKQARISLELNVTAISFPKAYIENILYNLISNALKYSKPDVPPEITISSFSFGDRVRLVVADNGMGIDMKKYGNRLFKLNQVFHPGADSKGVGLYLTKTQIESLGGTIEVISKELEGSTFIVTL